MTLPQRPLRGSRISTFYPVKNLPSLSSLDSAFQLQEYISLLIRLDVHDVEAIVSLPGKPSGKETDKERQADSEKEGSEGSDKKAEDHGKNDVMVDEACWIYEQLRRLAQDLTHPLITMLQQECTRASCPEMKAGEWLYLCVAHGNDGAMEQCCAIDYILHTLDSATALLNTPRAFPSRLQIPPASHRHFSSLARRLGRIFAHAYFHHREAFEQAEAESSLYARFLALTSKFELVPSEFLVIPQRSLHNDGDDMGRTQLPRLLGASTESVSQAQTASKPTESETRQEPDQDPWNRMLTPPEHSPSHGRDKSPGISSVASGGESPRKVGRHRTDTMVLHEGFAFAEELAKESRSPSEETARTADETKPIHLEPQQQEAEDPETTEDGPKTAKLVAETPSNEPAPTEEVAQPTETAPPAQPSEISEHAGVPSTTPQEPEEAPLETVDEPASTKDQDPKELSIEQPDQTSSIPSSSPEPNPETEPTTTGADTESTTASTTTSSVEIAVEPAPVTDILETGTDVPAVDNVAGSIVPEPEAEPVQEEPEPEKIVVEEPEVAAEEALSAEPQVATATESAADEPAKGGSTAVEEASAVTADDSSATMVVDIEKTPLASVPAVEPQPEGVSENSEVAVEPVLEEKSSEPSGETVDTKVADVGAKVEKEGDVQD